MLARSLASGGVYAGGNIQGKNWRTRAICPLNETQRVTPGRLSQAVANQSVDNDIYRLVRVEQRSNIGFPAGGGLKYMPLPPGRRAEPVRRYQAETDLGASIRQMACAADASPAITTGSSQYDDVRLAPGLAQADDSLLRQISPGILHHLEEIGPGLLDSHPIHLDHLCGRHGGYFDAGICEVS